MSKIDYVNVILQFPVDRELDFWREKPSLEEVEKAVGYAFDYYGIAKANSVKVDLLSMEHR